MTSPVRASRRFDADIHALRAYVEGDTHSHMLNLEFQGNANDMDDLSDRLNIWLSVFLPR